MRCSRPIKAGFDQSGSLVFSSKKISKELVPFEFECRKCLPCRLKTAREKAIRCWHETKSHPQNIFLTLTYSDEHLKSPKLQYLDFQLFMKKLRSHITYGITDPDVKKETRLCYMVTGEYGEEKKRPHWHVIIFNYSPKDPIHDRKTPRGDDIWTSQTLSDLWGKGKTEYGSVTLDSANYVARYAAKKLVHGQDQEHDYHPIHRTSSKTPIGRTWIEKHWKHTFENGFIVLPNGQTAGIPRYYQDWFRKNHPEKWMQYASTVKIETQKLAQEKTENEEKEYLKEIEEYDGRTLYPQPKQQIKETILKAKFQKLQERLKL